VTTDEPESDVDAVAVPTLEEKHAAERLERAALKKAASRLGWKLIGRETVEIKVERSFHFGPRTVIVRGRIGVATPDEMTAEAGEAALAPIVEPLVGKFQHAMERAATKILTEPDDVSKRHYYDNSSFYTALEQARRGIVREYQELENRRVDERVEADLGLRFYLESLTHEARTFEYFVGPTNSGKTHAAIEALSNAESGLYLAPLRLLALEIHERMSDAGITTSLVTGEERVIIQGARHVSSTVEMVDLGREVEVAVVDEAQMLQDEQRGWAWTLAIAGVRAKRVIMCGSEDGLVAAQQLAERLAVPITVRRFQRKNPLEVVDSIPLESLKAGDAVVAFTRNNVVELQTQIKKFGRTTAAIYGSLSPAVRRREAERFRTGKADVLVATDAIGLGLNLPIRRLIFSAVEKYDGVSLRPLTPPEMRQIAGRAGRYGIHEHGMVTTLEPRALGFLRAGLERYEIPAGTLPIWISPTDEHLRRLSAIIGTTQLSRLLQFFHTRVRKSEDTDLRIADLTDTIEVAIALETSEAFGKLPLAIRSSYSRAPVSTRGNALTVLARWAERHALGDVVEGTELIAGLAARDRLMLFEDRSRLATLYLWLAQRFPETYVNARNVILMREHIDADIHEALMQQGDRVRKPASQSKGKTTAPVTFVRRKGPPKFNKRKLPR
jgi:ATP-dependent RNA helicase SUPV3L1/SUV3